MKLRTTLLALVTIAILCTVLAYVAVANTDLVISASSVSCVPGDTVTVTLNIDQNPGFCYLSVYLEYDTDALTLDSAKNNTGMTFTKGKALIWVDSTAANVYDTGALATLTFTVNENAADGDYAVSIRTNRVECFNETDEDVALTFEQGVISVCSHSELAITSAVLPTCTAEGENIINCANCGIELGRETVPALGHTEGEWDVKNEATCTKEGREVLPCSVCGDIIDSNVIPMIPHAYDAGKVTVASTCAKNGVKTFSCVACGHSYTESIAKAPHTYDELGVCTVCSAESALYISTDEVKVKPGETFTVNLNLDRNAGAFYLSLYFSYDESALELVSIENGDVFDSLTSGKMQIFTVAGDADTTATGTLLTLTFVAKEDAETNVSYPIEVTVYECYNAKEAAVDAVAGNGSAYVYNYIYGDCNDDGKINGRDVTRLLQYLANFDPDTETSSVEISGGADCNGDNKINGRDVTRLLQYLANFDPDTESSSVVLGPAK